MYPRAMVLLFAFQLLLAAAQHARSEPVSPQPAFDAELRNAAYAIQHAKLILDFYAWDVVSPEEKDKVKKSKVIIRRIESIQKNIGTADDFAYEFWTYGHSIDPLNRDSGTVKSRYEVVAKEQTFDRKTKRTYRLTLLTGSLPKGTVIPLDAQFVFWNGYQGSAKEDWRARIQYPTKEIEIQIRFPRKKVVGKIDVWLADERNNKQGQEPLSAAAPVLVTQDKGQQVAKWSGKNIPGKHLILFEWAWADR